ncbi:MAG: cyclic nucleotide-binding protein [Candidatus Aenigmatarchaeota archaeon]|nr:MAG: cyclic nucleotide-binding protein [Candidatus Aenigmarchaeota archaeon]
MTNGKQNFSRIDRTIEKNNHILHKRKLTFGQKASDRLTRFCGSWTFIIFLFIFLAVWMCLNIYLISMKWDPYPFILLNFVLSCLAAIEAPIILMSQNREEEKAKLKIERDYLINKKSEKEIEDIQKDLNEIKKLLKKR